MSKSGSKLFATIIVNKDCGRGFWKDELTENNDTDGIRHEIDN